MTEKVKSRWEWLYRGAVLLMLGSMFTFAPKAFDAVNNRTFDSYEQKVLVIKKMEEENVITESQRDQMLRHMIDADRHMSASEKEQLIIIRENQKRIGQDLQEIKNLIRKNN